MGEETLAIVFYDEKGAPMAYFIKTSEEYAEEEIAKIGELLGTGENAEAWVKIVEVT